MKIAKNDFPVLVNNPELTYLDSACTSLKPKAVIDAEVEYYEKYGACASRSSHYLGRETTSKLEEIREQVANFVGASAEGVVWTKNTTEALNLIIEGFDYSKRKKVITTNMEHHAVLLPLFRLREEGKIDLKVVDIHESRSYFMKK